MWDVLGMARVLFTENYLRRVVAALPADGLAFSDIGWLQDRMKWPQQPRGWLAVDRAALRECVRRRWVRFSGGRYWRGSSVYLMPLPPLKAPVDTHDPIWPFAILLNRYR